MSKKLYVPNRILAQKNINPTPPSISKAFKNDEADKNAEDPSKIEPSVLMRLPKPTGYRLLVIPYYPKEKLGRKNIVYPCKRSWNP